MGRTIAVLVFLLSAAAIAGAQPPATSFDDVQRRVKAGETILVTDNAGATIEGTVVQVSDTSLIVRSREHSLQLDASSVQRIVRRVHTVRNGMLIGLAAGFVVGAVLASNTECKVTCFSSPGGVLLFGGLFASIGAGTGALVGSSIHRERVVFARPHE